MNKFGSSPDALTGLKSQWTKPSEYCSLDNYVGHSCEYLRLVVLFLEPTERS